ncbi:hypothetical protein RCL1_004075 [Eukaryota sp. TZLM3-RCL]
MWTKVAKPLPVEPHSLQSSEPPFSEPHNCNSLPTMHTELPPPIVETIMPPIKQSRIEDSILSFTDEPSEGIFSFGTAKQNSSIPDTPHSSDTNPATDSHSTLSPGNSKPKKRKLKLV